MAVNPTNPSLPNAAEIDDVLEISLLGSVDLAFWREKLQGEGLLPTVRDGRAEAMLCGTDAKFKGIRFRELSFSIFVSQEAAGGQRDGAYLVHAFNSVRFFAWVERTFFRTPYYYGQLEVTLGDAAKVQLTNHGETVLLAEMASANAMVERPPLRTGADGWSGPLYLPAFPVGNEAGTKLFHATLLGETRAYPFDPARDRFELAPLISQPTLHLFRESHFTPREWLIRPSAHHSKSKTVRRAWFEQLPWVMRATNRLACGQVKPMSRA